MKNTPIIHGLGLLLFVIVAVSGCQTVPQPISQTTSEATEIPVIEEFQEGEVFQFEPLPAPQIAGQSLEPIAPRNAVELLEEAVAAFESANTAQEAGDKESAYAQYTQMMELLLESDLDPN